MLPAGRKSELETLVVSSGHVTVSELAARFAVSADTIRRDLDALAAEGRIIRTRGGAMSVGSTPKADTSVKLREGVHGAAKERIAEIAVGLVRSGSSIIINAGSTGLCVARRLGGLKDLTVATNNILLPSEVEQSAVRELFLFGGRVRIGQQSSVGPVTLGIYPDAEPIQISADLALIGVGGLSLTSGYTMSDPGEAQMTAAMMKRSDTVAVLVDSSKFDRRLFAEIAPLEDADIVITDAAPPDHIAEALSAAGVRVLHP